MDRWMDDIMGVWMDGCYYGSMYGWKDVILGVCMDGCEGTIITQPKRSDSTNIIVNDIINYIHIHEKLL